MHLSAEPQGGKGAFIRIHNLTEESINFSTIEQKGISEGGNFSGALDAGKSTDWMYVEANRFSFSTEVALKMFTSSHSCSASYGQSGSHWWAKKKTSEGLLAYEQIQTSGDQDRLDIYVIYPANRWMSRDKRVHSRSLSQICIPGAHDAGMGVVKDCSPYANANTTQTQSKSFMEMLNLGVRYFDVRTIIDFNDQFRIGHFNYINETHDFVIGTLNLGNEGCMGYSIDEMLNDVKKFAEDASQNNQELVVLNLNHLINWKRGVDRENFNQDDLNRLAKVVKDKLGNLLIKGQSNLITTPISTLTGGSAKILVVFEADGFDGKDGIYSLSSLGLFDRYAEKAEPGPMIQDQMEKMQSNWNKSYFLLSWTLTQSSSDHINFVKCFAKLDGCVSIQNLAAQANSRLWSNLADGVSTSTGFPNILYTDFIVDDLQITINSIINSKRY